MIPVTPRTSEHFVKWCSTYQNSDNVPQPPHIRFSIGVYQISQGMQWSLDAPVKWQSYCAAAMHFTMSASGFGLDLTNDLPMTLREISEEFKGWRGLMIRLGRAQQMVAYSDYISAKSARKSRFDPEELRIRLHGLIVQCFSLVPPEARESCCFDEMRILTKDIVLVDKSKWNKCGTCGKEIPPSEEFWWHMSPFCSSPRAMQYGEY